MADDQPPPQEKKPVGRPVGSIGNNKRNVRELVETAFNRSLPDMLTDVYRELDEPRDRAKLLLELMPYCYPKLQTVEVKRDPVDQAADQDKVSATKDLINKLIEMRKK